MAQELIDKIRAAAQAMNLDPDMAVRIARAESSLSPTASVGTSTGKGLFGILDKTWQEFGGAPGKQMDPDENIRVGTRVIASNTNYLRKRLGREPSASEVYAAHFFGPSGASNFFAASPDTPMERVLSPRAIKANPVLQGKTAQEVRALLEKKVGSPAPAPAATATTKGESRPTAPEVVEPALRSGMTASADDLGQGYKAALALSFLGADEADQPEGEDQLQARMDREAEDTAAAELAKYKSFNALNDLQLSATSHLKQPVRMADGGEASASRPTPQEIERMALEDQQMREAASQPVGIEFAQKSGRGRQQGPISQALNTGTAYPAMARGVLDLPYSIVGAPVDLTTMALRPFGYGQEKPMMGSEWIKEKMTDLGVRPPSETDPTLAGFRTAGELGASLVNPAAAARKVGPVVEEGAKMIGRQTAKQMLRGMEGEGPLAAITPQPLYAVKPRGGTFATSGSLTAQPISGLDSILSNYSKELKAGLPKEQHAAIDEFIDKKVRKYFTNEFGTANDPLRAAMRSGEMPLYGKDVENFPEYMLAAARNPDAPGHAQAKRHLEKLYDERTELGLKALQLSSPSDADAYNLFRIKRSDFERKQRELMTAEGLPAEYQNPPGVASYNLPELKDYPSLTKTLRGMVEAGEQGTLPSSQVWALKNEQPIYDISSPRMQFLDPNEVAATLKSLDPDKLKNMSFPQAMIEGTKNMRVYREYETAAERASKGLSVPKEVFDMYTKPVLKTDAGQWVQITEPLGTKLEGKAMHHSVGGYADNPNYNLGGPDALRSGKAQVFSLRNEKTGVPEVTVEMEKASDGLKVKQIKGKYNSFPAHRAEEVFKLIDKNPEIKQIRSERYSRTEGGENLEKDIGVDWAKSYEHWKSELPGEWIVTREDPTSIDYVYGLPTGKAKGGMIERKNIDNRRYL